MTTTYHAPAAYVVTTVDDNGKAVRHQLMADSCSAARSTAVEHSGLGARAVRCFRELAW